MLETELLKELLDPNGMLSYADPPLAIKMVNGEISKAVKGNTAKPLLVILPWALIISNLDKAFCIIKSGLSWTSQTTWHSDR